MSQSSDPPARCPRCSAAASGSFCATCGAPLEGATCAACGNQLTAGANFCHHCGAAVGAHPAAPDQSGWLRRAPLMVALIAALSLAAYVGGRSLAQPARDGRIPEATAFSARAGSLAGLSIEEQADRLYDRIVRLAEEGKRDSVLFFAPMAVAVYEMLGNLDADRRYDLGRIAQLAGQPEFSRAQADTILSARPDHLLGLILASSSARMVGDEQAARQLERRLLAAETRELATGLPEYERHRNEIQDAITDARRR